MHKILDIDLVDKKVWQRIMRVHHFSHVLEPPKNKRKYVVGVPKKIFFFLTPILRFFAVRRKTNLEVTGEEKPKTRLR